MDILGTTTNDDAFAGNVGEHILITPDITRSILPRSGVPVSFLSKLMPGGDYFAQPDDPVFPSPVHRINFPQEGGTIYAVAMSGFTGGQLSVYGAPRIWRRR